MLQKNRISGISQAGSPTCAPEVIRFVKRIRDSIDRYAYCFNMYGLSTRLLRA